MRNAPSVVQKLAQHLLIHEAGVSRDSASLADAMERACDKLRQHLSKLMGLDGFMLLLIRALTLAGAYFPWLEALHVQADGSLKDVYTSVQKQEPVQAIAGFTAVLSHFFALLVTFIGEDLTLRLIQGIWPNIDLGQEETT